MCRFPGRERIHTALPQEWAIQRHVPPACSVSQSTFQQSVGPFMPLLVSAGPASAGKALLDYSPTSRMPSHPLSGVKKPDSVAQT